MPTIRQKVDHVLSAAQTRTHGCHWPGCPEQVPPAKWGCTRHWYKLPRALRNKVWVAYRPGQESDLRPSERYLAVAREIQDWIKQNQEGAAP